MPKSRSKKKYKKKKNPNRAPQTKARSAAPSKPASGGKSSQKSAQSGKSAPMNPKQRQQMWIAIGIAALVFLLLIWIANLNNKSNQAEESAPETETVESADAATEGDAESGEDAEASDAEAGEDTETDAAEAGNTDEAADASESVTEGAADTTDTGTNDDAATDAGASDAAVTNADAAVTDTHSGDTTAATDSSVTTATDDATTTAPESATTTATDDAATAAPDSASTEQTSTDTPNAAAQAAATQDNAATAATETASLQSADADAKTSVQYADITVQDYGKITVELDPAAAPKTVENFVKLANEKFYNGLTFHRIMDGFMIQGGDPQGDGFGGSGENIVGEFESNGFKNDLSHVRGTISMARSSGDNNSASSQFFIVQTDSAFLDGDYAAFGHVTSGMEIVDKICKDAKPTDNNGSIKPDEQPVIESIVIREA